MDSTGSPSERSAGFAPYAHALWSDEEIPEALAAAGLSAERIREELPRLSHRAVTVGGISPAAAERFETLATASGSRVPDHRRQGDSHPPPTRGRAVRLLVHGSLDSLGRLGRALESEGGGLAEVGAEILRCVGAAPRVMSWGRRRLEFGPRPLVMGILNCTPDSFYPGSRLADGPAAIDAAARLIAAGADILDVGGESTRPGSDAVSAEEEIRRVLPVVEGIRRRSDVLVSIDTRKPPVAEAALDAGADLVNDIAAVSGGPDMLRMLRLVAQREVPVVLMHMRGEPKTMQADPCYEDAVREIIQELAQAVGSAVAAGVRRDRIIVDPGIGFGKRCQDNLAILRRLRAFTCLGCPLLIGLSRKSFLGTVVDEPVEQRLIVTVAANTLAVLGGADIVRVHDVREAVEMATIVEAVRLQRCRAHGAVPGERRAG
jgi:dihydropteroate synthase